MSPRIGELFAGYGGLGMGVQAVLGGEVAWFSEFDTAPSKILAHHWPNIPNLGDITLIDWSTVPPIDILTGGFPCQDVSLAGARRGLKDGTRSGLWSEFARAIDALKPELVVIENVRGLLSATAGGAMEPDPWGVGDGATRPVINALGAVLGDLADLGYDTQWCGVRAADAGAPHGRYRIFIVAHPKGKPWGIGYGNDVPARGGTVGREPNAGASADAHPANFGHERTGSARGRRHGLEDSGDNVAPSPLGHPYNEGLERRRVPAERPRERTAGPNDLGDSTWGQYAPAVRRWETVMGRPAPAPTNSDGKAGNHRLSAAFVEWMMGLPAGHVTDVGLTRNEQLKALGNGVVWQQAALALRVLLGRKK